MLIKYSVKNFKSIKDNVELNLNAVGISELSESIISKNDDNYLPLAVIYGPNGGGKSNILESIFVLRNKLIAPILSAKNDTEYTTSKIKMTPFLFNKENINKPIAYEIIFSNRLGEYKYNISFENGRVVFENLDFIKFLTNRRTHLFDRNKQDINPGEELKKLPIFKSISESISEEIPLLSLLGITSSANEIVADIKEWLLYKIRIENFVQPYRDTRFVDYKNEKEKKTFLQFLKELNIDIEDYKIERNDDKINIYTIHNINGYEAKIDYIEESNGTKKIFSLAPLILQSLFEGTTLIIDELDAKLHPLILKHIIEIYSSKVSNKYGAQLIFTSHDMTTMSNDLFRRDEIWFAAKGNSEDTQLYSLIEFKDDNGITTRKDAKYNKQYLEGKYGADPYFQKIINWEEIFNE